MLVYLFSLLAKFYRGFDVFQYLSLRAILSVLTAFFLSIALGPYTIRKLLQYKIGQSIRDDGPQSHLTKTGTPTMGGILILMITTLTVLLWTDLANFYIWLLLFAMLSFGSIGFVDDFRKLRFANSKGMSAKQKIFLQSLFAIIISVLIYYFSLSSSQTQLVIPFFKNVVVDLGWFFFVISYFTIVGSSNAVNLTDGLDGLAIMPVVLVAGAFAVFAYVSGNHHFASYLLVPFIPGTGEIAVFCAALIGAGLGFLWFNTYPAQVFMGDTGSLGLGAVLGAIAVAVRQELLLVFMGGIFVMETVSVILQVAYFKMTRKRIFRMAPIHHHFELKGWEEPKVIVRFWIITFLLVLCGLATLKLR